MRARLFARLWQGPPHPVNRVLSEGDEVAGFRTIHAPGHAPGEVIFWRESDRVARTAARSTSSQRSTQA